MSRQRIRASVLESSTERAACGGSGHVRSVSSVALQLLRGLEEILMKGATIKVSWCAPEPMSRFTSSIHKRAAICAISKTASR